MGKFKRKIWTELENELMISMFSDNYTQVLCEKLGRSYSSVVAQAFKLGLKKSYRFVEVLKFEAGEKLKRLGKPTRIKKGNIPPNKGKPVSPEKYQKMSTTFFKKGSLPHNTKYNGHERITKDGYVEVRVEKGKYLLKHRIVWEEANGIVPKGCVVVFKDKNKLNIALENLEMITTAENMTRNSIQRYSPELKEVIHLNKKLNRIIDGKDNNRRKRKSIQDY